jgi:Zn-dependent peptidase ImmA (M78 family)/DNA-binding XRE family transcriptional regulator
MPITQAELGRRLRAAREACGMTQEEVAGHLGVSRTAVAQMELGNRAVTSLELDRLAYLYGRDIRDLLSTSFHNTDALTALFRAHPDVIRQDEVIQALRRCLSRAREITSLEQLLEIQKTATTAIYPLAQPRTRWDAIQQGSRIADEERRRLGLGALPVADVAAVLEAQGVRTAQAEMPDDVSGFTLSEPGAGLFVVVNRHHAPLRQRFSYAHEYSHVLLDRGHFGAVSRERDRDELIEVRANVFAANFLMPEDGVRQSVAALGKGLASRQHAEVFDETAVLRISTRTPPRSQDVQLYDVVQLAHHFGVSRLAALYRLHNLRIVNEAELERLKSEDSERGRHLAKQLELSEEPHVRPRHELRHRLLGLALEALRRGLVTRAKFDELARMAELRPRDVDRLLRDAGLGDDEVIDVLLPGD